MFRKRPGPNEVQAFHQQVYERRAGRDKPDGDEGRGDPDAEHAEEFAVHRLDEALSQQVADFGLEGRKIALVRVKAGANDAAARHRGQHRDAVEKP